MAERSPFVYPDWCTGPSVDLDILPPGFPVCDQVSFVTATYVLRGRKDPPDLDPPPFCPCATWTTTGTSKYGVTAPDAKFDVNITRMTSDCCAPEFKFSFDVEVPCMPFELHASSKFTSGPVNAAKMLQITKYPGTCKFKWNLAIPQVEAPGVILCLYERGAGVQFVTCCSGTGYIGLDFTMFKNDLGTIVVNMYHEVNLKIPLLARLATYSAANCAACLSPAANTLHDPWNQVVRWNASGDTAVEKYCKQ